MGHFSRDVIEISAHLFSRAKATEQGGVISGSNPAQYNKGDPFQLWVIQVVLIIFMTQLLSSILGRIRQPRVISEVIGGIILGPTVMGRIPGFTKNIFPDDGMPILAITSTIGLIIYLFLVGLEIDTKIIKRNAAASGAVSVTGLVIPLGLGAALGVPLYHQFVTPDVNFGLFILFVAVAIGITAFPVLCRILTELKLLDTTVGIVTLSAGVGNDVVGWILLALTVALVNASNGLTALYVLLSCVGYVLVLLYPGRWAYVWLARRTGSLEQGTPTTLMMAVTLLLVLISAFFTDIIGVHAIFGGFIAGLIVPHDNGYAISMVEKLEDLVSILFIPIYFTLSGLKTNLGALDTGIAWGYTVLICVVAFFSKFLACGGAALFVKFNWREAGAIGSLMSCKGLVELIVLNVGLQAQILDVRTFSMFVVHALVLTFMTTPLVEWFYPENIRKHDGKVFGKQGSGTGTEEGRSRQLITDDGFKSKISVILDKIDQVPAAMTLSQLLNTNAATSLSRVPSLNEKGDVSSSSVSAISVPRATISIDALRLVELTTRPSAVFKSQAAEALIHNDPVVSIFRTFGAINRLPVSASLSVVNYEDFPDVVARHASEIGSQLVVLPWSRGSTSVHEDDTEITARNPFDGVFHKSNLQIQDQTSSVVYSEFIRGVFLKSPSDVALFVDRGLNGQAGLAQHHIFLPFFGGPDDRLALSFLVQLCHNPLVTATVVRITKTEELTPMSSVEEAKATAADTNLHLTLAAADTVYGNQTTQTRLASSTADSLIWDKYTESTAEERPASLSTALSRITFSSLVSSTPLHSVLDLAEASLNQHEQQSLMVFVGRSRRMAVESHEAELRQVMTETGSNMGSSVPKTLGDVGAVLVAKGIHTSILVMQAAVANSS